MITKANLYEPLYEKQGGKCAECGTELMDRYMTHIDRMVRGEEGGAYVLENCRLICKPCDWLKEGNAPNSPKPKLASVYRIYKMWQELAGSMDRKLKAYRGEVKGKSASPYFDEFTLGELDELLVYYLDQTHSAEMRLKHAVRLEPEWKGFMKFCPGMGEITAAHILSHIDINKADTVSALWRYFGFDPSEPYNPGKGADLKSPLYAALSIFMVRTNSPYRADYDKHKARLAVDTKHSGHGQALHRCIKLWLSHLWETWRIWAELPTQVPYANNHLGHTNFIKATERGWPS